MKLADLIGNTPLVELQTIPVKKNVTLLGKLEGNNPGGSVKDRAAYGMIKGALDRGDIKVGDELVEATSGNTGIAGHDRPHSGSEHDAHYARQFHTGASIVDGSLRSESHPDAR